MSRWINSKRREMLLENTRHELTVINRDDEIHVKMFYVGN